MPGGGRPPGSPNKATSEARRAIADFVDNNADRLQGWLDEIANGIPATAADGNLIRDAQTGAVVFRVAPNPEKAFNLFQSVIEYHVPKLQRVEQTGAGGGPVQVEHQLAPAGAVAEAILKRLEG